MLASFSRIKDVIDITKTVPGHYSDGRYSDSWGSANV